MVALIFIVLTWSPELQKVEIAASNVGNFTSMQECFFARESLSNALFAGNGYYPPNTQAICIPVLPSNEEQL